MIRNLKMLFLALVAVTALAAVASSAAQAATKFTNLNGGNTVLTTTPDGTGTTAHHLFDSPAGEVTCTNLALEGTVSGTEQTADITMQKVSGKTDTEVYTGCKNVATGLGVQVNMHGCDYKFGIGGTVAIEGASCTGITFSLLTCVVQVTPQDITPTAEHPGVTYHNINPSGTNEEVTVEAKVGNIHGNVTGCPEHNGSFTTGTYTTGNTIITGETDPGTTMKPVKVD